MDAFDVLSVVGIGIVVLARLGACIFLLGFLVGAVPGAIRGAQAALRDRAARP
jgi:hypothetical protein